MLPIVFPVRGAERVRNTWEDTRPVWAYDANGRRYNTGASRPHLGIDIVVPRGTNIYSTTPGTIAQIWNERQGRPQGNAVMIRDPDGLYHLYAHLLAPPNPEIVGWTVRAGQYIGKVGTSGSSDGPHLHYQISRSPGGRTDRVNPYHRLAELFAAEQANQLRATLHVIDSAITQGGTTAAAPPMGDEPTAGERETLPQERVVVTREMAEEAREAVRALLPSVERALERLAANNWQRRLLALVNQGVADQAQVAANQALALARPFMTMIRSNVDEAERFPSSKWMLWYPTWQILSSITRMLGQVSDPLATTAAATDNGVVGALVRTLVHVRELYDDVRRSLDESDATVREIVDDVREAPGEIVRGGLALIPEPPSAGTVIVGVLLVGGVIAGAAYAFSAGQRR